MGFKDKYVPSEGGGLYIGADEKQALSESGVPIKVEDVTFEPDTQYGEQYELSVTLPTDPEEPRKLAFAAKSNVGSRDDMLEQAADYFENDPDSEPFYVKLEKRGRAWILEITDEEEAKPKARSRARAKK